MQASVGALVTVVIPAYNSERVIGETLESVLRQTHRRLEVLIVDDGSRDATRQLIERYAAEDARVRLIAQPNAGVCAARNRGIAEARGDFIAFLDADDLWRPAKIEKQLAAFEAAGARAGLAYTGFMLIDQAGRIVGVDPARRPEGEVLREICRSNFVGQGSSPMMRREVFERCGGFDPNLPQGCEDHLMYFRIARAYDFVAVQEPLVGYRLAPTAVSTRYPQVLRSGRLVFDEMRRERPDLAPEIEQARLTLILWQLRLAVRYRRPLAAAILAAHAAAHRPADAARHVLTRVCNRLARARRQDDGAQAHHLGEPFLPSPDHAPM